jgi:precorrin-6B methylase 2
MLLLTQTALAGIWLAAAALALLPFLGAGVFLALAFTSEIGYSRELYAADMLGAGLGCLVSLPALQGLGAEHTMALAALVLLAISSLLQLTTVPHRWLLSALTGLCLSGVLVSKLVLGIPVIKPMSLVHSRKHLGHILRMAPSARIVDSYWSALARTDVVAFPHEGQHRYAVFTDGGAATMLVARPDSPDEWRGFDRDVGMFPYDPAAKERVLIIGSGGGLDILLALRGGALAVTAVEVNADVLRAAEQFVPPARNVYHAPNVEVIRGDGRLAVRQTPQSYDVIVLPQVYTGAAQHQGGALVEHYVLTTEAFQDYLAHLSPQGRLVVQVHDTAEVLKTVSMAMDALAPRGIGRDEALDHLLILQETPGMGVGNTIIPIQEPLVILKNTPYTLDESQQQARKAMTMHLTPLFIPHMATDSPLIGLLQSTVNSALHLTTTVRPATDDRPFFYETDADLASLAWMSVAVLALLLSLLLRYYTRYGRFDSTVSRAPAWLPFVAITGCAALLMQVALLQRFMLVLGSPTLTLVALLFPLLFFGGVGSLASRRLSDRMLMRLLPWSCVALSCLLVLVLEAFPLVRSGLETQGLFGRTLSVMLLLAPLGVLMGLPFPVALRLLSPMVAPIIPWLWGVNAVACVLGSVVAMRFALSWGLSMVISLSALLYLLAGGIAYRLLTKVQPSSVAMHT